MPEPAGIAEKKNALLLYVLTQNNRAIFHRRENTHPRNMPDVSAEKLTEPSAHDSTRVEISVAIFILNLAGIY